MSATGLDTKLVRDRAVLSHRRLGLGLPTPMVEYVVGLEESVCAGPVAGLPIRKLPGIEKADEMRARTPRSLAASLVEISSSMMCSNVAGNEITQRSLRGLATDAFDQRGLTIPPPHPVSSRATSLTTNDPRDRWCGPGA
jgi:hypothetical protein